jgi:hypothetical protein
MQHRDTYADERLLDYCIYCGDTPDTKEHVPSKSLLNTPYPENLHIVGACKKCNNGFSFAERYFSNLLKKIKSHENKSLDETCLNVDKLLIKKVVVKICQGHAAFELSEVFLGSPSKILANPLIQMTNGQRAIFESPIRNTLLPEVGSRFMIDALSNGGISPWVVVQDRQYRFMTGISDTITVKAIISEYLACEVVWNGRKLKEDIAESWLYDSS